MIHVDPPFDLGETLKGTDDDSNEINSHWEGAIFSFPDYDRSPSPRGSKKRRSGATVRAICCRNTSGGNLVVAKKVVKFDLTPATARQLVGSVDGQGSAVNQLCGVGDNELTGLELTTGVASKDLFWVVIGGPATVLFKDSENIAIGDLVTSSATAGAAIEATSGSAAIAMASAANILGRALEADASTSSASLLIHVSVNI